MSKQLFFNAFLFNFKKIAYILTFWKKKYQIDEIRKKINVLKKTYATPLVFVKNHLLTEPSGVKGCFLIFFAVALQ